jgi:hypothetical protein
MLFEARARITVGRVSLALSLSRAPNLRLIPMNNDWLKALGTFWF